MKAIIFSRVSTMRQDITQQTQAIKEEARRNGYDDKDMIFVEYHESAIKLDTDERLGIRHLKQSIEQNGDVDCVFIYEISRLSRRQKMLYDVRDYLLERKINLICMKPYFRLLEDGKMSQTASILFSLFGSLSESEMMLKQERMMRGKIAKREQNKYIGGGVIFGYRFDDDNNLCIDESDSKTVQYIFNKYAVGNSLSVIAKDIWSRGLIKTSRLNSVVSYVHDILKRIEYTGIALENRYRYPQIISRELYEKCKKLREDKHKQKSCPNQFIYWCKGLLRDRNTGDLISGHACMNRYEKFYVETHTEISINLNVMDSLAWYVTKKRIKSMGVLRTDDERQTLLDKETRTRQQITTIAKRIADIEKSIDRVQERIVTGKLNETKGDIMINKFNAEIADFEIERDSLIMSLNDIENRLIYINSFLQDTCTVDNVNDDIEIRELIRNEIKTIWLKKRDERYWSDIQIVFNDDNILDVVLYKPSRKCVIYINDIVVDDFELIRRVTRKI